MTDPSDKAALRRAALAARAALPAPVALAAAGAAAVNAMRALGPVAGRTVALYVPVRGEIDSAPLAALLRAAGAVLCLPAVSDPSGPLTFRAWSDGAALVPGYGRIPEPALDAPAAVPDLLVVPLAAFDRRGYRIGYGQGHYDRTLPALRAHGPVRAVGLAYAAQEVPAVPAEDHDAPLDAIATECDIIVAAPLSGAAG